MCGSSCLPATVTLRVSHPDLWWLDQLLSLKVEDDEGVLKAA